MAVDLLASLVKTAVKDSIKNQSLAATALVSQSEARAQQIFNKIARRTATGSARRTQELASGQERDIDPGARVKQELSRLADKGLHVVAPEAAHTLQNFRQLQSVVRAIKTIAHAENPLTVAMGLRSLVSAHKAFYGRDITAFERLRYTENDEILWRSAQANGGRLNHDVLIKMSAWMPPERKDAWLQQTEKRLNRLSSAGLLEKDIGDGYRVTTLFYHKHIVHEGRKIESDTVPQVSLYNMDRKIMTKIDQAGTVKFDAAAERVKFRDKLPAVKVEKELRAFDRSIEKLQKAGLVQARDGLFSLTDLGHTKLAELNELNRLRDTKDFKCSTWDQKNILLPIVSTPQSLADWEANIRKRYSGPEGDRQWRMISRRIEKHAAAGNVIIENDQVRLSDQGRSLIISSKNPFEFSKYDAQQVMPRLQEPISRDALRQSFVEKYPNATTFDRQWTIFEKRLDKNVEAGTVSIDEFGFLSISARGQETLESFRNKPQTAQAKPAVDDTKTLIISKQDARIMQYARDGVFSSDVYRQLRRQEEPEIENDLIDHELQIISRRLIQLQKVGLAERTSPDAVQCSDFLADRSRVALERSRKPKEIALSREQDELIRSLGVFANVTREQALQHIYGGRVPLFELDLADLKRRGLIDTVIIPVKNYGEQQVLGLSKFGRQVAGYRIGDDQILTESKVNTRPAEMAHDLLIFDAYQDAKGRLEAAGKDVTIVYSDRQSKSIDMRELGRQDEAYADLKVVYKDRETGEIGTLNLEVAVNYKDHEIAKKSSIANCLWYTPGAAQASRIRRVLPGAQVIQFA
jgi:hypothetical protein